MDQVSVQVMETEDQILAMNSNITSGMTTIVSDITQQLNNISKMQGPQVKIT